MSRIKLHRVDHAIEKQIVTGMVISDKYLQGIKPIYNPDLLAIPFARKVAGWCMDYYNSYGKAPNADIQAIYESHSRNGLDPDQSDLIGEFLSDLSDQHERADKFNAEYLLDQTEIRFKARSLEMLGEDITAHLSRGELQDTESLIREYKQVERPTTMGIDPLTDKDAIIDALATEDKDKLFKMPGALGKFLGAFERDMFVAILGSSKKGKSYWLMEFAFRALRSRCNVAYFMVGDMSQRQTVRRIHSYLSRRPVKDIGAIKVPVLDCAHNQDDSCTKADRACDFGVFEGRGENIKKLALEDASDYVPCTYCMKEKPHDYKGAYWHKLEKFDRLEWRDALASGEKLAKRLGGKSLKLVTHSAYTANVQGMKAQLDTWGEDGFVPDVIVIDYADILAPEDKRKEFRHQVNDTWGALRGLSQERHCLVLTATQADAASYDQRSLGTKNFSEDKRKNDHVNMIISLNQTNEEKVDGLMRVGKMFVREDDFDLSKFCHVIECRALGRPYLGSYL